MYGGPQWEWILWELWDRGGWLRGLVVSVVGMGCGEIVDPSEDSSRRQQLEFIFIFLKICYSSLEMFPKDFEK